MENIVSSVLAPIRRVRHYLMRYVSQNQMDILPSSKDKQQEMVETLLPCYGFVLLTELDKNVIQRWPTEFRE